ncbi:MAG: branched-chain amino acid transport system II carrier protein [Lactobacillaceae bacterium]|jgi:LIVCS family branched-chain amino acid:cation transporter|nr:branched-chain amino acid transport system II carrier protein [Lactobacillaceae bacterium]
MEKYSLKRTFLLASVIFGMFFGAGNLIFPVHLGQLAGSNWWLAAIGFILSATIAPYLAMLAVAVTKSEGLYDIAKPVSRWFGLFMVAAVLMTLGPLFAIPRTAAVAFTTGIAPLMPVHSQWLGLLIYSGVFFALAYYLTTKEGNLISWIGRWLNPLFLIALLILFIVVFALPMGGLQHSVSKAYQATPIVTGFLEGYNTMDGLSLLMFAFTIVFTVRGLGVKDERVAGELVRAGFMAILLDGLIYLALIIMGTSSLAHFKIAENGGQTLAQVIRYYAGDAGILFTAVLITLAVFTTAMGVMQAFAQGMNKSFPRFSYLTYLRFAAIVAFLIANLGLTQIIAWSTPMLMFLYPIGLPLIFLALFSKFFDKAPIVYQLTIGFVAIPAILDGIANAPVQNTFTTGLVAGYHQFIPYASLGLGWLIPGVIGFVLGFVIYKVRGK